jgi:Cu(I)/Ag(I) efflux system membrane fusion protein
MNSKKTFPTAIVRSLSFAILAGLAAVFLVSCKKSDGDANPPDVDYYTCTMHPSVHSHDPHGKCPICGMELVPVKKKATPASPGGQPATNAPVTTNQETTSPTPDDKPGQFSIPLDRQQQIGVTYAAVVKRPFQQTVRALGTVAYDKRRRWDYVARVDGYAQKVGVFSRGEPVEKGAFLLTIYSPALLTAQQEFVNALKMRDDAQAGKSPDLLHSATDLVDSGRERLRLWNISDDQVADLEKTRQPTETLTLFSPFKGVVQETGIEQGSRVSIGERLVAIADLSVIWVWAQFYQDELPMLTNGLPATITVPTSPGEQFTGTISLVDPFVNDALRTTRVRIDVPNPGFKLRPDMYVDFELSMDAGYGLALPVSAVLPTGSHNVVFVDKGEGKLEPRYVELGGKYGPFYEVKSGLAENERVVTSANFLIDAEAQVQGVLKSW